MAWKLLTSHIFSFIRPLCATDATRSHDPCCCLVLCGTTILSITTLYFNYYTYLFVYIEYVSSFIIDTARATSAMFSLSSPLLAYADAQSALERIDERRRLSPVRRPWRIRCQISERQALARIDNRPLDDDVIQVDGRGSVSTSAYDLSHWSRAVAAKIDLTTLRTDPHGLLRWLGAIDEDNNPSPILSGHATSTIIDAVKAWQEDVTHLHDLPPLLHSAYSAHLWMRRTPIGRGDMVAALLIGDRYGPGRLSASFGGLVALGLDGLNVAWRTASAEAFADHWLRAITAAARHHLDLEVRLRAYAARAMGHIAARRRPGMLKPLLMLAMAHPLLTSRAASRHLGLTSAGAIKLLTIATDLGLLLERSGQASYRTYSIPVTLPPVAPNMRENLADSDPLQFWSWDQIDPFDHYDVT